MRLYHFTSQEYGIEALRKRRLQVARVDELATVVLNQLRLRGRGDCPLHTVTAPTPLRKRALGLLGVRPDRQVPINVAALPETD